MKLRNLLLIAVMVFLLPACAQKNEIKPTKNLIVMIADGNSTSLLSVARWYKRYQSGDMEQSLNVDPYVCGLVQTNKSDAAITGSAESMSAFMTGVRSSSANLSIYPEPSPQDFYPQDSSLAWRPAATVLEAARLWQGKATGLVVTIRFNHATPAATCTHAGTRSPGRLSLQMASQNLDVVFGGGMAYLTPEVRSLIKASGASLLEDDLEGFRSFDGGKLWALFNEKMMDFEIDRDPDDEPSLAEMTAKAIDILSKNPKGFFLMVEGSKIDHGAHSNDASAAVGDFLAFDEAIKVAIDFAQRDKNTTVVITSDHGTGGITIADRTLSEYVTPSSASLETIFGSLGDIKASSHRMTSLLRECELSEIPKVFKEWTGIDITPQEDAKLRNNIHITEEDYMQVADSYNFQRAIVEIYNSHMHIGFASGNHTAEDVFLAVYHPHGQRPSGIIKNVELNEYLCKVSGFKKPLWELTDEIFVPYEEVFPNASCTVGGTRNAPFLTVVSGPDTLLIPGWQNVVYKQSSAKTDTLYTRVPSVYMRQNGMFYIDRTLADLIK
jgi:alkaline phosphatase